MVAPMGRTWQKRMASYSHDSLPVTNPETAPPLMHSAREARSVPFLQQERTSTMGHQ